MIRSRRGSSSGGAQARRETRVLGHNRAICRFHSENRGPFPVEVLLRGVKQLELGTSVLHPASPFTAPRPGDGVIGFRLNIPRERHLAWRVSCPR